MAGDLRKRTAGYSHSDAVKRAVVSTALEGGTVDHWQVARLQKYAKGEITAKQLVSLTKRAARRFT